MLWNSAYKTYNLFMKFMNETQYYYPKMNQHHKQKWSTDQVNSSHYIGMLRLQFQHGI